MHFNRTSTSVRLSCLLALALCPVAIYAQSGRRQTKVPPAAPIPSPTPEPTPKPKAETKEPELGFLVGIDRSGTFETYPFSFYEAVLRGCGDRLRSGSSARVDLASRDLTRGEAVKKAKAEQKTYVVLLQLSQQSMSSSPNAGYDNLELGFVVFAPVTAKIVTSGRTYQNSNSKGPLIVGPRGSSSAIYREQLLRLAGEDAGNRILKALHLTLPTPVPR